MFHVLLQLEFTSIQEVRLRHKQDLFIVCWHEETYQLSIYCSVLETTLRLYELSEGSPYVVSLSGLFGHDILSIGFSIYRQVRHWWLLTLIQVVLSEI